MYSTNSIAFICKFSYVGISSSVINSAIFWESKGFCVDIYCERPDLEKFPLPEFTGKKINWIASSCAGKYLFDDLYFRFKYLKKCNYIWIIGFDHSGIIRAMIATLGRQSRLIYHSLEFFEPTKPTLKNKIIKYLEILSSYKSKFIFAQDKFRIDFLKTNLFQKTEKFKIIYNSGYGLEAHESSAYFRDLFKIPEHKKIVLCVGSLIKEHYIKELLDSLDFWDNNFVLILHGWIPDESFRKFIAGKVQGYPNKVFLSEKLFGNDSKDVVFQSCDIGFVGFVAVNNNLRFAAGSAGKIFDFLKCGKPIIGFNTPGMKEIIEGNRVGIVFNSPSEISAALRMFSQHYEFFKHNTSDCFKKYDFMRQYENTFKELE